MPTGVHFGECLLHGAEHIRATLPPLLPRLAAVRVFTAVHVFAGIRGVILGGTIFSGGILGGIIR